VPLMLGSHTASGSFDIASKRPMPEQVGAVFGLDQFSYLVGPRFQGVKMVPPGAHYISYRVIMPAAATAAGQTPARSVGGGQRDGMQATVVCSGAEGRAPAAENGPPHPSSGPAAPLTGFFAYLQPRQVYNAPGSRFLSFKGRHAGHFNASMCKMHPVNA
jgi:hypothetical protein